MTFLPRSRGLALGAGLVLAVIGLAAPVIGAEVGVSVVDKTFQPAQVTVHAGDTVKWTVAKSIGEPHSVTAGTSAAPNPTSFDSGLEGLKDNGGTFSHTFPQAGTFDYFCTVHATVMTGQVVVLAAGGEAEAGVPAERRLIAGGILVVTLVVLFGAARVWRRMNPA